MLWDCATKAVNTLPDAKSKDNPENRALNKQSDLEYEVHSKDAKGYLIGSNSVSYNLTRDTISFISIRMDGRTDGRMAHADFNKNALLQDVSLTNPNASAQEKDNADEQYFAVLKSYISCTNPQPGK